MHTRIFRSVSTWRNIRVIYSSKLFDNDWYLKRYKEQLSTTKLGPAAHYYSIGWKIGNDPSTDFSTESYLARYPDVRESGHCPLLHFEFSGRDEGRVVSKSSLAKTAPSETKRQGAILFIVSQHDFATQRYRVFNFTSILQEYGWAVRVVSEGGAVLELENSWDIAVLNRISARSDLIEAQRRYRARGGLLIYDVDDFIFDPDQACLQDSFRKRSKEEQLVRLEAMERIRSSLLCCDLVTVTTEALAREVVLQGKNAVVIPNGLSSAMPLSANKYSDQVDICYLSGTSTHDKDFEECEAAISDILEVHSNVNFHIVGQLKIGVKLENNPRVLRHEFMEHNVMLQFLSSMDINLAPLELENRFTACKSELKVFEAAYYSVPTIASATSTFSNAITSGANGILAQSYDDWFDGLSYLVTNESVRREIGEQAKISIAVVHSSEFIAAKLHVVYAYLLANKDRALYEVSMKDLYEYCISQKEVSLSLIRSCGLFNEVTYQKMYPDVSGVDLAEHFLAYGSFELRKPSRIFDPWWYNTSTGIYNSDSPNYNSLLHAIFFAKSSESQFSHPVVSCSKKTFSGRVLKRACLFAGYDGDGVVDDTVLTYIGELSKYCDVFYMADCEMRPGELEKLSPLVRGAWAERHGEYDFGSYKRLLTNKLGWNAAENYDEILFANDSVFLLDSLEKVFADASRSDCSWWGMQATKGTAFTKNVQPLNLVKRAPQLMDDALLSSLESSPQFDFHVGSYFVAFRKNVVDDPGFRKIVESVSYSTKKKLILEFEIGITRYLLGSRYKLHTFIRELHAFHPIYSEVIFHLIEELGFPFLKKYLITNNHYRVPELGKLLSHYKCFQDGAICRNLERTMSPYTLSKNLNYGLLDSYYAFDGPKLSDANFAKIDKAVEKDSNLWVFPVCYYDHMLTGNDRALFEHVKNDPRIRKVILTRSKQVSYDGLNVYDFSIDSPEAQQVILHSKTIFVKHGPRINIPYPCEYEVRNFVNLWHGVPLKRIGVSSLDVQGEMLNEITRHNRPNSAVISSSHVDRLAMTAGFYPLTYNDVFVTGLPRIDLILKPEDELPDDMLEELNWIRSRVSGKRLVLFAPTFRNGQEDDYYQFSDEDRRAISSLLADNNLVIGVREHMADTAGAYNRQLDEVGCLNFSSSYVSNIEMLYRAASVLVTDYSSCFIDFLMTGKPVISFAYDLDRYSDDERGFYYEIGEVFPGPICQDVSSLCHALDQVADSGSVMPAAYARSKKLFFDFDDANNSERVAQLVCSMD